MHFRRVIVGLTACFASAIAGCRKSNAPAGNSSNVNQPTAAAQIGVTGSPNACPATGKWAACSVLYRLERAGLAPKLDSGATPQVASLRGEPLMLKIGAIAKLEVHLFADSTARVAAAKSLERAEYVSGTQMQTIRREKTLIESANLIGLLTSINAHQRERVYDALTAGPPQP